MQSFDTCESSKIHLPVHGPTSDVSFMFETNMETFPLRM
jgi:hypothetical protein